jgi:hypothetical protein
MILFKLLGPVYHAGRRRAGRLGFAVFGGGYFALAFLGLSDENLTKLPTRWLLFYVHQKVAPTPVYLATLVNGSESTITVGSFHAVASPNRWQSLLPGAGDFVAFSIVGHCLFALLAGPLGAIIARWYQARQDSVRFDE